MFLVVFFEASEGVRMCSDEAGEGTGEMDFSENSVVEESGDALPQPKNDPNLDALGDFGRGLFVILKSYD
jgi:hypothetical protein